MAFTWLVQMLSITSAARQFKLPRDVLLNAVREGTLNAVRDGRGILRIKADELDRFCRPGLPTQAPREAVVIFLEAMQAERFPWVLAQQRRLLRAMEASSRA